MVRGFIPDFAFGVTLVSSWHEGAPQKSSWKKTKASARMGIPIEAFRCSNCGYLALYANGQG